jgi:hypothetical protein
MDPNQRIDLLERRVRALTATLILTVAAFSVITLGAQSRPADNLRVREITVVDAQGTERVWIGAPVPDPIENGRRVARKGAVSGVILLDAKGNERSGYVTSDGSGEVFMSLDSERGQEALFLMNPGGGGHLSIYDAAKNQAEIGIVRGRPTVRLEDKGQVIFEQ